MLLWKRKFRIRGVVVAAAAKVNYNLQLKILFVYVCDGAILGEIRPNDIYSKMLCTRAAPPFFRPAILPPKLVTVDLISKSLSSIDLFGYSTQTQHCRCTTYLEPFVDHRPFSTFETHIQSHAQSLPCHWSCVPSNDSKVLVVRFVRGKNENCVRNLVFAAARGTWQWQKQFEFLFCRSWQILMKTSVSCWPTLSNRSKSFQSCRTWMFYLHFFFFHEQIKTSFPFYSFLRMPLGIRLLMYCRRSCQQNERIFFLTKPYEASDVMNQMKQKYTNMHGYRWYTALRSTTCMNNNSNSWAHAKGRHEIKMEICSWTKKGHSSDTHQIRDGIYIDRECACASAYV